MRVQHWLLLCLSLMFNLSLHLTNVTANKWVRHRILERVCPFSSPLFRTSGQLTGWSESTIEHNIVLPDVRNENRTEVRNEKIHDVRNIKWRMTGTKIDGCSEWKNTWCSEHKMTDDRNKNWRMFGINLGVCLLTILRGGNCCKSSTSISSEGKKRKNNETDDENMKNLSKQKKPRCAAKRHWIY